MKRFFAAFDLCYSPPTIVSSSLPLSRSARWQQRATRRVSAWDRINIFFSFAEVELQRKAGVCAWLIDKWEREKRRDRKREGEEEKANRPSVRQSVSHSVPTRSTIRRQMCWYWRISSLLQDRITNTMSHPPIARPIPLNPRSMGSTKTDKQSVSPLASSSPSLSWSPLDRFHTEAIIRHKALQLLQARFSLNTADFLSSIQPPAMSSAITHQSIHPHSLAAILSSSNSPTSSSSSSLNSSSSSSNSPPSSKHSLPFRTPTIPASSASFPACKESAKPVADKWWSVSEHSSSLFGSVTRRCKRCRCPNCINQPSSVLSDASTAKRQHICHICKKIYGKTSHLKAHLRWHAGRTSVSLPLALLWQSIHPFRWTATSSAHAYGWKALRLFQVRQTFHAVRSLVETFEDTRYGNGNNNPTRSTSDGTARKHDHQ